MDIDPGSPNPAPVLTYFEAAKLVQQHAGGIRQNLRRSLEQVKLTAASGRVLAEAVRADRDQPPFRRSTRDGFACRAGELLPGHALHVTRQIRAGEAVDPAGVTLNAGEAVEIMTGAPVPDAADCVVMVEHVSYDAAAKSLVLGPGRTIRAGENIVPAGAEAQAGSMVLAAGLRLEPRHIAVAAACGYSSVKVFSRPAVAVLATGDELVEVDKVPLAHQIRNSNSYSLAAQILASGGIPLRHDILPDQPEIIRSAIHDSLSAELVLLSGGVSMGRFDFVEQVLLELGAEFFFTGVLIQPGRPVVFGRLPHGDGHRYFLGLPGNPVSTLVTFALFAAPLLTAVAGETTGGPRFALARLAHEVRVKGGLTRFLPAILDAGMQPAVRTVPWQGSGDLAATATTNCYLVAPPERELLSAGEVVSVLMP